MRVYRAHKTAESIIQIIFHESHLSEMLGTSIRHANENIIAFQHLIIGNHKIIPKTSDIIEV